MPNYEFKTEKCYPSTSAEQAVVAAYQKWGWEILDIDSNKQVFVRQDSDGTKHYSTSSYVKMRRDLSDPRIAKVVTLEREYDNLSSIKLETQKPKSKPTGIGLIILGLILVAIGVYYLGYGIAVQTADSGPQIIFGVVLALLGIGFFILRFPLHKKSVMKWELNKAANEAEVKKHNENNDRIRSRIYQILNEVNKILNE